VILRAAYATRGRGGLGRAKAGVRYVIHRPSDTASREYRTGFDADFDRIEKSEAYDRLDAATGLYFYRLTLAPGEGRHVEADLHDWTRRVMDRLEERASACDWVAWAHGDHSNHDHVHVVAVLEHRLDRDDLRDLRDHADAAWQRERERCRDPLEAEFARERDHDLEREQ
jgi:hypothetical protein